MASDILRFVRAARFPAACGLLVLATACSNLPALSPTPHPTETPASEQTTQLNAAQTLHAAIDAAHPQRSDLPRARALLNDLLAADDSASRQLQPYAQALLDQIQERQRLTSLNARLRQQLNTQNARLQESEQNNAALQSKLDALAEIERQLKPRKP